MKIDEMAEAFAELHQRREAARLEFKGLDEQYKRAKERLGAEVLEEGLASVSVRDGEVIPRFFHTARVDDRDQFVHWAKEAGSNLVHERERQKELNGFVRFCLSEQLSLPPGVTAKTNYRFRVDLA